MFGPKTTICSYFKTTLLSEFYIYTNNCSIKKNIHGCQDIGKTVHISRLLVPCFLKQSLAHCPWYDYLVTESIEPPLMSVGGGGGRGRVTRVTCSQLTPVKWVHYCYWGVIISLLRNFYHPSYSYSQNVGNSSMQT